MTTTAAIIIDAYREANLTALGKEPNAAQVTEGMARLASLVAGVYGYVVGERLQDWAVGYVGVYRPAYVGGERWRYPLANSRIFLRQDSAQHLYLPRDVDDGARIQVIDVHSALAAYPVTLDANGLLIENASTLVLNTDGLNKTWIFDAPNANWTPITGLDITDEMPFAPKFDDYFIIKTAGRINPRYGRSLSDLSLARLGEMEEMLEAEYRQRRCMPAPLGVRRLETPNRRWDRGYGRRNGQWGWM